MRLAKAFPASFAGSLSMRLRCMKNLGLVKPFGCMKKRMRAILHTFFDITGKLFSILCYLRERGREILKARERSDVNEKGDG